MKKNINSLIILLGCLLLISGVRSQDVNFTQYFSTPMYYNPAFTGINTGVRARFLFRNQWPSLPVSYKSYFFSADIGDRGLPGAGGIGLYVNSNNDGVAFIHDLMVALNISVRIPITSYLVSQVGIKAGIGQRRVNWDDLVWSDQLSELYGNIYQSSFVPPDANKRVYPDFGIGGLFLFANQEGNMSGTAGVSLDHVFQPDIAFLSTGDMPLPRKWVAHTELVFTSGGGSANMSSGGANDPLKINPGILYENQAHMSFLQAGLNIMKFNVYLGGWFKTTLGNVNGNTSALALLAGYRYNFNEDMSIRFIYSYDMQISGNLSGTGGAHEISLAIEFGNVGLTGSGRGGGGRGTVFGAPGGRGRGSSPLECPSFY
jgi:type IX secretion system PorP/SprF family membrane protein